MRLFGLWLLIGTMTVAACGGDDPDNTSTGGGGAGAGGPGGGEVGGGEVGGGGGGAMGGAGGGEVYVETSSPTPDAEILQTGNTDLLLRGVVLTPSGVLDPGEVLVIGNTIACVDVDCTTATGADTATWINTNGVISPGLIDGHNHMSYNFLPEWVPDPLVTFNNRYQWADDPQYEDHILPYSAHRSSNSHFCPGSKWAELRSLAHGTTTMQGQPSASGSCIDWAVRNANRYHGLGYDHMRANIGSVRDLNDADADNLIMDFDLSVEPTTRYVVHMAEGISGNNIDQEFDSFAGRDPRENRHNGVSLLHNGTSVLIHSVPLTEAQLEEAATTNAKIVWSPLSNMALYGAGVTAPIGRILELGITTGLGPDWTISGEDEMLGEMRFAINYTTSAGIPEVTPQRLWEMATFDGAHVLGLDAFIGRLEVGYRADIAVFGRSGPDPYAAVLESRIDDVRLVLIDGAGFFGDDNISVASRNAFCDAFDACGTAKFMCVQDSPTATNQRDETLADIRTQLYNILEGIGYPAEEQYGRGDELLELANCDI